MSNNTKIAAVGNALDSRYTMAKGMRRQINKVFPTHWSFLLGEIALYSFVILLISGVYLTLFFDPSMSKVIYQGAYAPLNGIEISRAYETALNISFEVRGGLFVRQIHHWAALLFVASMVVHMIRIFFTGAFRRPREANWVIGCVLLLLGIVEGFLGYGLPDDVLSGTGLRITSAIIVGLPVIGTWMHWMIFGGDFPGEIMIPRFYVLHVLIIPAIILALIAAHLALVWYQKHTQFPGPGRTEKNVVGVRILPVFAVKSIAFGAITVGMLMLFSGLFTINAIWNLGPYNPSHISAGSQPDWYMLWTEGGARVMPAWEIYLGNYTIPAVLWVAVMLGAMVAVMFLYPWIEAKLTGDTAHHNLLQRPRDVPVRTAAGVMALTFYVILVLMGSNDLIAYHFNISLNATTWAGRIGLILLPPVMYFFTYRLCLGLQRADRAVLEHGIETGIIMRMPQGEFVEVHQPLGGIDEYGHAVPLEYAGAKVPSKMNQLGAAGRPPRGALTADPVDEVRLLDDADHSKHDHEHSMLTTLQEENRSRRHDEH
ncbi:cytochrome bc1 complex cytochrome b subunit [Dietzia psychralcaliphila]|uniref:cytochrome bc1 complex cytochrome b subunit n=1 Tax=Dietzia psychralcaliphila TaxID=139021 RepID=UPI001C1E14DF|nr:cytochrome bc complex cytochrome b subunit [Dietzia psychralcaliphila]